MRVTCECVRKRAGQSIETLSVQLTEQQRFAHLVHGERVGPCRSAMLGEPHDEERGESGTHVHVDRDGWSLHAKRSAA